MNEFGAARPFRSFEAPPARTAQGEAQAAQAELPHSELSVSLTRTAEQPGGWGLTKNASVLVGTTSQAFTYDDLYQLRTATGLMQHRNDWRYRYSFEQEYDEIGNIVVKDQSSWRQVPDQGNWRDDYKVPENSYVSTYTYGGTQAHTPSVISEELPNESNPYNRSFTYDASGNQTQSTFRGQTRSIVWNEDDQIKQVIKNGQELNRTLYDAQGQKTVHLHRVSGMEETAYLGPNLTIRDGKYLTKHIFAGGERASSKMDPSWFQNPPILYYHGDHLGSAHYVTNDTQELIQHTEYFPSGELWQTETDSRYELARRHLFTGKELDIHTGLYDFGARSYDARQGQWLSPDPILASYMGGAPNAGVYFPANQNLYGFVYNSPLVYADRNGETPMLGLVVGLVAEGIVQVATGRYSWINLGLAGLAGAASGGLSVFATRTFSYGAIGGGELVRRTMPGLVATISARVSFNAGAGAILGWTQEGLKQSFAGELGSPLDGDAMARAAAYGALGGAVGSALGEAAEIAKVARVHSLGAGERNLLQGIGDVTRSAMRDVDKTKAAAVTSSEVIAAAVANAPGTIDSARNSNAGTRKSTSGPAVESSSKTRRPHNPDFLRMVPPEHRGR